jgi:CheY-like chemotaxis protein
LATEEKLEILIVDDEEGHAELVSRNLRRCGFTNTFVPFTNGEDALNYVLSHGADTARHGGDPLLILLDIKMPGRFDGVDVLKRLKADPEKRKIPIIMLTTTDDPREISRCYDLGCNVYLTKPVDPGRFVEAINRLGLFLSIVRVPANPLH